MASNAPSLVGMVYAAGELRWSAAGTENSMLVTESGFTPAPAGTAPVHVNDRRFAAPSGNASAVPPVDRARNWVAAPLSAAQLRSSAQSVAALACRTGDPVNVVSTAASNKQRTTSLCLHAGTSVRTTGNVLVTVPLTDQWLVIPNGTAASSELASSTVDVYYATNALYAAGESSCSGCDLMALVADQLDPEREDGPLPAHPGFTSSWTKLGTFNLPSSGVIATDATTSYGFCGDGFTGAGCATWGTATSGARATEAFTLIAGSIDRPANIYLAGSVAASSTHRPTLIATGRIVVPYWSRVPGGNLSVTADLISLAAGNAIAAAPSNAPTSESNTGGSLVLHGMFLSASGEIGIPSSSFSAYQLAVPANAVRSASPLSPSPSLSWVLTGSRRMSAADISQL